MPWTPLSETVIANMAIDVIDDSPIADLTDGTPVADFMNRNFWPVFAEILYAYPWYFARKYQYVAKDASDPPFGWDYSYTLPEDCIRPLPIRSNGVWNGPIIPSEIVGPKIYTNYNSPLPLIYISREENPGKWTPAFGRVFAMTLALYAAHNMTGKATYVDKATGLLTVAWESARLNDTLSSGTPEGQSRSALVDIRGIGLPSATGFHRITYPT